MPGYYYGIDEPYGEPWPSDYLTEEEMIGRGLKSGNDSGEIAEDEAGLPAPGPGQHQGPGRGLPTLADLRPVQDR